MDIDGRAHANVIKKKIKEEIINNSYTPTLAFFLMQDHGPSKLYVSMKEKGCKEVGITSIKDELIATITEEELLSKIIKANKDPLIDAIIVQMPLPPHINPNKIILAIDPIKDVDGFHPVNIGKMILGEKDALLPCTPNGIVKLLEMEQIDTKGKNVVIIGRSNIVGRPLMNMLSSKGKDATVTLIHSQSKDIDIYLKNADIIITALGIPLFLKDYMVKEGASVIDVGISHLEGKLVGDVDYEKVKEKTFKITKVPGGVGPMTIAMLLSNTLQCHKNQVKFKMGIK